MKNSSTFSEFSLARKINLVIALVISAALAIAIPVAWHRLGSPVSCCLVGSLFGLVMPMAVWMQVDEMLAN